jgi:hypothetical protein
MKKQIFLSLFIYVVLFLNTVFSQETNKNNHVKNQEFMTTQNQPTVAPFADYLCAIGSKLGCYFTLEYRSYALAGNLSIPHSTVVNNLNIPSVSALISELNSSMQGFNIARDANNSNIIHIVESTLNANKAYALNCKINLRYSGNLGQCEIINSAGRNTAKGEGLVTAIAKQVPSIQSGTEEAGSRGAINDCVTLVNVNATNESVRNILTDSIPLGAYNPVLWRAVTVKTNNNQQVLVQFFGPKH